MKGTIVKGIAGFYYVKHEDQVYQCKARGLFKKDDIKPMVGDIVEFEHGAGSEDDGWITEICERKNSFIRPPISNVDCFVIVMAAAHPKPNLAVMDKFLVMAEKSGTDIIVCINKTDLAKGKKEAELDRLKAIYEPIYPVVCLSGTKHEGIDELKALLSGGEDAHGRTDDTGCMQDDAASAGTAGGSAAGASDKADASDAGVADQVMAADARSDMSATRGSRHIALAGPSGVGKSTLLNCLIPEAAAETGTISHKSKRGKHTTRHSELFDLGNGVMLFDTPGFTSFEILEAEEDELHHFYPEMAPFAGQCKYDDCRHIKEPDCAVRAAVEEGRISQQRYDSYVTQLKEIQEKNRY